MHRNSSSLCRSLSAVRAGTFAMLCALSALCACSKTAPNAGTPTATAANKGAAQSYAGNACERKLLSAEDFTDILAAPVTGTKPLKGDPQSCYFISGKEDEGGPELMVSLRPGHGAATIGTFTSGHMNQYAKWKPLAGVGDGAVWLPELREVNAQKNDLLCVVHPGLAPDTLSKDFRNASEELQQQKLGALCNTIFTRLNLPQSAPAANAHAIAGGNIVDPACDKDVSPADVADILTAPVVRRPGFGPQSCTYRVPEIASVTITLSKGDEGKAAWDAASNPGNAWTDAPLGGVGESALQGRGGTVVYARKGDLVCNVGVTGTDNVDGMKVVTKARGEELARKLGALCSKVFAARG